MDKSYCLQDGCHNCGMLARTLELVIDEDDSLLCGHEPIRERKLVKGVTRDIVKFAEVHPAGKCSAWRGIA
jgi:hypothetical protein